jgi:MYXO-CTERM domain-containing protein
MGSIWRLVLALLVGFAVFYVLAPTSGAGHRCYSWPFGLEVPCGIELAMGTGSAAAVLIGVALLWVKRRRMT